VVLDDGHWMDSASWAMAERVGRQIPSLMVVIGTRPFSESAGSPPPEEYQDLLDEETSTRIVLVELEPTDALELVENCLGVTSLPGPVSGFIVEQADVTFFSEEIGFALRDAGCSSSKTARVDCSGGPRPERDRLPHMSRRSSPGGSIGLSVMEQSILRWRASSGRSSLSEMLADVYPGALGKRRRDASLTGAARLIQPVLLDEGRYRFRHAITRDIAYGLLLFSQRHELHRAVARWMETEYADDPDSILAPLAYHYRNSLSSESPGEDVDRALDYLGRAGRKSLRGFAHREAIGFLNDAIALSSSEPRSGDLAGILPGHPVPDRIRARWEQDLAEAHLGMGRVDQSAAHFEKALQLHGHPMGKGKVGVGARLMAAAALQAGHRVTGARARALDPEQRDDLIEAATAYERLMKIYYYANDPAPCCCGCLRAPTWPNVPGHRRCWPGSTPTRASSPGSCLCTGWRTYQRRSREVANEVDRMPEHAWAAHERLQGRDRRLGRTSSRSFASLRPVQAVSVISPARREPRDHGSDDDLLRADSARFTPGRGLRAGRP
jgi:tetratricopeptide (TPR) repeat protein